ncbi:hypothetical protein OROGR_031696 [Orobanche gracilis]
MVGDDVKRVYLNPRTRPYYLRRCRRARLTDIQSLPDELLSEILTRLPADYIHDMARLVCLRWYHIVHSPDIVRTQIQHSTYGLMLSCQLVGGHNRPVLVTATEGGQIETCEFSYRCKTRLYGSCNGLALDHDFLYNLLSVMNPATKQHLVLPPCSRHFPWLSSCAIAYAAASMEYKVVVPLQNKGKFGDWFLAILTVGVPNHYRRLHPLGDTRDVMCVDTGCGDRDLHKTSTAPLPQKYSPGSHYLSTGRLLSLLIPRGDLSWEVWGMGSRDGEWSKVLPDIDLGAQESRLHEQFGIGEDKALRLVGWVKCPEVLALCFTGKCRTCVFFNLETNEIRSTELPESFLYFTGDKS